MAFLLPMILAHPPRKWCGGKENICKPKTVKAF
jgi:hypothetical protein